MIASRFTGSHLSLSVIALDVQLSLRVDWVRDWVCSPLVRGSTVEVLCPLANGPFRGILMPANVNTHGCEDAVRSVGSWYLPRLTTAPVLGRPTRRWLSIRRGSPITPPGLDQHRELNLDGPPQRSHFNRSDLGVHNTPNQPQICC